MEKVKECQISLPRIDKVALSKGCKRYFPCVICESGRIFYKHKRALRDHMERVHQNVKNYFCGLCPAEFYTSPELERHVGSHTAEKPALCTICSVSVHGIVALYSHEKIHFNSKYYKTSLSLNEFKEQKRSIDCLNFSCIVCEENFSEFSEISDHIKPFVKCLKCNECGCAFKTLMDKHLHYKMKKDDDEKLKCKYCFKLLSNICEHTQHESTHVLRKKVGSGTMQQCPECPVILHFASMKSHIQLTHAKKESWECEKCKINNQFDTMMLLKLHESMAHNNRKSKECHICQVEVINRRCMEFKAYTNHIVEFHTKDMKCLYCNRLYTDGKALLAHIHRHIANCCKTESGMDKPITCKLCSKSYPSKKAMSIHMRLFHINKPKELKCEVCEKAYTKQTYNIHLRRHLQERPYKCDVCGKCWTTGSDLTKHLKSHANVQKYPCMYCQKSFTIIENRRRHELTVHSENKVNCDVCSKSFSHWNYLRDHMVIHNVTKQFKCKFCPKAYKSRPNMYRHIREAHKNM